MNPLVSILIPVYNGKKYLAEAIQSAIDQTYDNIEIVIVDDNSSDNSVQIATGFKDVRLRVVKNKGPHGIGHNWNKCIESSKGDYYCLLHQDDVLAPKYVSDMLDWIQRHSVTAVYCPAFIIDAFSNVRFSFFDTVKYFISKRHPHLSLKTIKPLFKYDLIMCPTVFYDKHKMKSVGLFDVHLKTALDYEMWFRVLLQGGEIDYFPQKLYSYRRHDQMCSRGMEADLTKFKEDYALKKRVREQVLKKGGKLSLWTLKSSMIVILLKDLVLDLIRGHFSKCAGKIRFMPYLIFRP